MHGRHLQNVGKVEKRGGVFNKQKADTTTTTIEYIDLWVRSVGPMGKCFNLKSRECLGRL